MYLLDELKNAILREDFYETNSILEKVYEKGDGFNYVEPLINIMESNPNIDFGVPGPVVHFIEKFPEKDYVEILLKSLQKSPTIYTLWMLNRIINDPASQRKSEYIQVLLDISKRSDIEVHIREQAREFYEYQTK